MNTWLLGNSLEQERSLIHCLVKATSIASSRLWRGTLCITLENPTWLLSQITLHSDLSSEWFSINVTRLINCIRLGIFLELLTMCLFNSTLEIQFFSA